jgi:antitoxin (DNA-binding transcriptional repressor) of toxin-antitoxin stability system
MRANRCRYSSILSLGVLFRNTSISVNRYGRFHVSSYVMQTTNLQQLRDDASGVIQAAQSGDVYVINEGKVVAVVSRPPASTNFAEYWRQREEALKGAVVQDGWDSTRAIEADRDRA